MRAAILAALTGDATLMGLLTGGIHTALEISRQYTPAAFDTNGEILPCALLRLETEGPTGPYRTSSRLFAAVLFYQRHGYDVIDQAVARTFAVLHERHTGAGMWQILHADDVLDQEDQALGCSLAMSRFAVYRMR